MPDATKKAKPIKFLCFRYAVIPNGQMGIWQDVEFSKRHIVDELVRHCSDVAPYASSYNGVESVLLYTRPIGETAHLLKFCRKYGAGSTASARTASLATLKTWNSPKNLGIFQLPPKTRRFSRR